MKTELRNITPELATKMLEKNFNNRKISDRHVVYLSNQMRDNQWQFDGQPVRFDKFGRLLDGQHRLSAVVKSGKTIQFLIVSGLDESTFKVMDTGKNRSAGDVLSVMGLKYSTDIASIAKTVLAFKRNSFSHSATRVVNSEIVEWYNNNDNIVDIIRQADSHRSSFSGVLSRSHISVFMYLFNEINIEASEEFIRKLCTGLAIDIDSPIFILRKKLISDKMSKARLPQREKFALICKAWNLYRLDKKCRVLKWNKETEKFPNLI